MFGGTATGHARFVNNGTNTELVANTDADLTPEIRIVLTDGSTQATAYNAQDVLL